MKITIVQGAFNPIPPLRGGAVEKVWYGLAAEFQRQGHQVTYISRRYGDLAHEETTEGIHHVRIPGFDPPASLLRLKMLDLIYSLRARRRLPPADILVTHCFWLPMLVRTEAYGKLCVNVNRYPKRQMRLYRHAARLQAVSGAVAAAIVKQTPDVAARVAVLPNPLPDSAFAADDDMALNRPRQHSILYLGRVHPEKGIGLLLEAYQRFKVSDHQGWRLVIVGPWESHMGGGGNAYYAQLKQQYHALADSVEWVGPVFEADRLREYYLHCGLFIYPSIAEHGEALPVAPLEAMACGCSVLVSGLECFQDYLQDGSNGFVFDHRVSDPVESLAHTLTRLAAAEDVRRAAAIGAVATARRFAMRKVAEQYLGDFRSLVEAGK